MCLTCGCHEASNQHGDPRHLVLADIRAAAEASGISTQEAAQRILAEVTRALHERMLGSTGDPAPVGE